jgi:hypothetical protein
VAEGFDGALAEFTALRQEILNRLSIQNGIIGLQLTAAGALFGFALSSVSQTTLLVIIPMLSYVLLTRYLMHGTVIADISDYIRQVLSPRIPDGLGWESHWRKQPDRLSLTWWRHPNMALFPGSSALALGWAAPNILGAGWSVAHLGLVSIWVIGLAVTGYSGYLMWRSSHSSLISVRTASSRG